MEIHGPGIKLSRHWTKFGCFFYVKRERARLRDKAYKQVDRNKSLRQLFDEALKEIGG